MVTFVSTLEGTTFNIKDASILCFCLGTCVMVATVLRVLRKRSICGSHQRRLWSGRPAKMDLYMNKLKFNCFLELTCKYLLEIDL